MSMEGAAWHSLWSTAGAQKDNGGVTRQTVRRTIAFAKPYRARLVVFVVFSVISAFIAVATPLLAGQIVNAIVARTDLQLIIFLAGMIALVAVADVDSRSRTTRNALRRAGIEVDDEVFGRIRSSLNRLRNQ